VLDLAIFPGLIAPLILVFVVHSTITVLTYFFSLYLFLNLPVLYIHSTVDFLHLYLSTGSFPELLQLLLVLQQGLSAVICFILLLLSTTISSLRCYLGNINWPYVRSLFMALGNNALRIQTLVHRPLVPFGYEEFFLSLLAVIYYCKPLLMWHYITTPDSYSRNGDIFTVGAAGVGGAPTVGVLGPQQPSRPYRCHCRGGW